MQLPLPNSDGFWCLRDANSGASSTDDFATTTQLLAEGMSPTRIRGKVQRGEYIRICRSLYSRGRNVIDRQGTFLIATLATGGDAMLMELAALESQRYSRFTAKQITIGVSKPRTCPFDNVEVRRTQAALHGHRITQGPLPMTSHEWTISTLGRTLTAHQITNVIHQSQFRRIADLAVLKRLLAAHHDHPGHAAVTTAVAMYEAGSAGTRSVLEDTFLELVRIAGVRMPAVNRHFTFGSETYELDCFWESHGWNVELDGGQHRRPNDARSDRERDTVVRTHGGRVKRFGWHDVHERPWDVVAWLQRELT